MKCVKMQMEMFRNAYLSPTGVGVNLVAFIHLNATFVNLD